MPRTNIIIGIGIAIIAIAVGIFLYRNKTAPATTAPATTAPATTAPTTPVTCACDNSNQQICNNYGSEAENQHNVDGWNKSFENLAQYDRIAWLGTGSCKTMPADVAAKLEAKKSAPTTPPPHCVCDNGVPGKCLNYGSDTQNQHNVAAWNQNFANNNPARIAWIGSFSDSCREGTMPADVAARLEAQKIPGCVCDSRYFGTCINHGSIDKNQINVDTLNQSLADNKDAISWLGKAEDRCRNMPPEIFTKLNEKKSFLATRPTPGTTSRV